jgi:hypothetical protein
MLIRRLVALQLWAVVVAIQIGTLSQQAAAELVLHLDATEASRLTLSTDVTAATYSVGGFPFPDTRQSGLHFVEGWGQTYGATSNPNFSPVLKPLYDPNNLTRPTFDPNGLGAGKPSVNFDYDPNAIVLSQGQWLFSALDNFIYSDKYSIFFVASATSGGQNQVAFGQDYDFRPEGWNVGINSSASARWRTNINGDIGAATVVNSAAGTGAAAAIRSIVGKGTSLDYDVTNSAGVTTPSNTAAPANKNFSMLSGGALSLGNRGGEITGNALPFNGKIGEIAIFNTELNATERASVNAYLASKWLGAPAPTPLQTSTAQSLLQQAAPTVGAPQLVRYAFAATDSTGSTKSVATIPDLVASGVTASNFGTGNAPVGNNPPSGISISTIGISANSAFLDGNAVNWNATTEQTPAGGAPNYLTFTLTPDAGKQIDPYQLAFALSRQVMTPANYATEINNVANSFGVWINSGSGFVKVGGQVAVPDPVGTTDPINGFFDTYTVDLSSLPAFTQATEVRLYLWHDGLQTTANNSEWQARVDNVRLRGDLQNIPVGTPGDYNNDGKVDAADYVVWRKNVGTGNVLPNDSIGGMIGSGQYTQWRSHFGLPSGSGIGVGLATAVPEPTALAMMLLAAPMMLLRRSHRITR